MGCSNGAMGSASLWRRIDSCSIPSPDHEDKFTKLQKECLHVESTERLSESFLLFLSKSLFPFCHSDQLLFFRMGANNSTFANEAKKSPTSPAPTSDSSAPFVSLAGQVDPPPPLTKKNSSEDHYEPLPEMRTPLRSPPKSVMEQATSQAGTVSPPCPLLLDYGISRCGAGWSAGFRRLRLLPMWPPLPPLLLHLPQFRRALPRSRRRWISAPRRINWPKSNGTRKTTRRWASSPIRRESSRTGRLPAPRRPRGRPRWRHPAPSRLLPRPRAAAPRRAAWNISDRERRQEAGRYDKWNRNKDA